ncbi:MAG: hypothetical protein L3J45_00915 [Flavobacteriaceae bacterium]|nr:hypothetical protein [Flavobacteriaceae bacterium]
MITYRLAKTTDALALAKVHKMCAESQKDGFFYKLGILFIWRYYKIVISNRNSIILLAEDENGFCYGFHSGTLKAEEHLLNLKKNRLGLFFCVLPDFFLNPKLFLEVFKRYHYISNRNSSTKYGVTEGPRGEYWGWIPSNPNPVESLKLHKKWHKIIKDLGINFVKSEVDITNSRVFKSIKIMGGEILSEMDLPDGRKRAIVQYDLAKFK